MARLLLALAPRTDETNRMAKPTIRVLHHLARSGGTLISKCLGSMEGVFLLSEIHPLTEQVDAAYNRMVEAMNPLRQAIEWHRLPTEHDLRKLGKRERVEFSELLVLLAERAQSRGGTLLVRDWTHLDFIARPFLPEPTFRLTTAEVLREVAEVESHITVRHPVDQLVSLSKLGVMQGSWDLREYFYAYRVFAEVAREVGFTRYEDFTRDPTRPPQRAGTGADGKNPRPARLPAGRRPLWLRGVNAGRPPPRKQILPGKGQNRVQELK
jgi:hypothetical protein